MAFERDHPNPDLQRNLDRAQALRAVYLGDLFGGMAAGVRNWLGRRRTKRVLEATVSQDNPALIANQRNRDARRRPP